MPKLRLLHAPNISSRALACAVSELGDFVLSGLRATSAQDGQEVITPNSKTSSRRERIGWPSGIRNVTSHIVSIDAYPRGEAARTDDSLRMGRRAAIW